MTLRHDVQHPQPSWVKGSLGNAPCSDGCITILSDDSVSGTQARTGLPAKSLSHLMSCVAHFTCQAKPSLKSPAVMHTHMHARTHAHTHTHMHTCSWVLYFLVRPNSATERLPRNLWYSFKAKQEEYRLSVHVCFTQRMTNGAPLVSARPTQQIHQRSSDLPFI